MDKTNILLNKLNSLPFLTEVKDLGGEIYAVGGIVRDAFLNKDSKDFDIMVTGIEYTTLTEILEKHGKVDLVGESFGIIKFKEIGSIEDIDISLPRKETATGDRGHKAFDVTTDPFLSIEDDLNRRDLTINSIALSTKGDIVDPFNGLDDIKRKIIRMTNPDTFFEDPLRMLRAIVFASRFEFEIESETFKLIKDNRLRLKEISPERILIEFGKIVTKGNPIIGVNLLISSELGDVIFGRKPSNINDTDIFDYVSTLGEFIFLICAFHYHPQLNVSISEFFLKELKGDNKTAKEIKALEILSKNRTDNDNRWNIFLAINEHKTILDTKIFPHILHQFIKFKDGTFPNSLKELAINGNDLLKIGFEGINIKLVLEDVLDKIFYNGLNNNKADILNYIHSSHNMKWITNKALIQP